MPYYINNECIGCTICAKKCPVPCIWGGSVHEWAKTKEFHIINPPDCIECGVCASYCPVDCIQNEKGVIEPKIEAKQRPSRSSARRTARAASGASTSVPSTASRW